MKSLAKERYRSELRKIDWDFTGENGTAGFAAYHWYPARYVPQLAGILINYFSAPGETVLDPFCGSGTTLVECYKSGRFAIGIDVNPTAVLMTKAKLVAFDEKGFSTYADRILERATSLFSELLMEQTSALFAQSEESNVRNAELRNAIPNYDQNSGWYHPDTLRQLASIWLAIHDLSHSKYYDVGCAAFSAILRYCCSQEKHWGWICDNVKPKAKDLIYKNAMTKFSEKLREYKMSATNLHLEAAELQDEQVASTALNVYLGNCVDVLTKLDENSFHLVVTSPPYYNMTDYVSSQRLSNLWFNSNGNQVRTQEIGARYKRHRITALEEYLRGMRESFSEITRVLKRGRFCCVVLGESPSHEPFLNQFEQICSELGLESCDSLSRRIAQKRSLSPQLQHEKIFLMKKK